MATTNDIKNGKTLRIDGVLWNVLEFQHVKPGKGGAFVRTKLKNVLTGKIVDRTFNAGAKIEFADVDRRDMEYLYNDGESFIFMDGDTFDQIPVEAAVVGDNANFLLENTKVTVATHEGNPLYIELPAAVELEITHTDPGVQGDRSTGGTKPAEVQTGATIQVPLFITTGERVKVDTRSGDYLGRAN
ncbi:MULTISPECIES: elongation factor P [unclassified Nocardiopsis]|uniref:elongation factor P n=1 Tax=unclassified Nocardiopsis TaxID=2649073 RepID=UPI00048F932D|nr:elongation factor P [Nocardiopsis sp. CNT312]